MKNKKAADRLGWNVEWIKESGGGGGGDGKKFIYIYFNQKRKSNTKAMD